MQKRRIQADTPASHGHVGFSLELCTSHSSHACVAKLGLQWCINREFKCCRPGAYGTAVAVYEEVTSHAMVKREDGMNTVFTAYSIFDATATGAEVTYISLAGLGPNGYKPLGERIGSKWLQDPIIEGQFSLLNVRPSPRA